MSVVILATAITEGHRLTVLCNKAVHSKLLKWMKMGREIVLPVADTDTIGSDAAGFVFVRSPKI